MNSNVIFGVTVILSAETSVGTISIPYIYSSFHTKYRQNHLKKYKEKSTTTEKRKTKNN